jgi:membrane associated rhomboid family serine protease
MIAGWLLAISSREITQTLAIVPRKPAGLVGIITAPFLHANLAHLTANLAPFLVLGALVLRRGEAQFIETAVVIAVAQGLLLWIFGRNAAHVGMSGVIFGFLGFLLAAAWHTRTTPDLFMAAGVLIFYGSMLAGVVPARDGTSWEGHLFGALAGLGLAWFEYAAH